MSKSNKKITAFSLALMGFTCVWGFGNITNGFGYFGGTRVILPWILVFVLYFMPYILMVGELGATFKDKIGGVSSWIYETIGPKVAFFCGWIYWVVHMPYLSQKPSQVVTGINWVIFQNGSVSDYPVVTVQLISLAILLVCLFIATRGIKAINKISALAGASAFVMSILYIIMVWTAPAITGANLNTIEFKIENFIPQDWTFLFSMSILIFGVGGGEKIAPYVNQIKNPGRKFPWAMTASMVMVVISAMLGTLAMGMMFDINNIPSDFLTNGQYEAFQILGNYYGLGNFLMIVYAISNSLCFLSVLIISIDAPLRIMLGNADKKYFPSKLFKTNKYGSYTRGVLIVGVIASILILLPCLGIGDVDALVKWLIKLNSVCMPIRYLFVFAAYIALKLAIKKKFNSDYHFIKNKKLGIFVGSWCFFVTLICCIIGMISDDPFMLVMNIATPIVLVCLGFIMPALAKRERKKLATKQN
ncbi:MAG: amino acid permease [Coriobacteriia bacterium]|nr:amino acid permease [Coriobacteriia bacterium]